MTITPGRYKARMVEGALDESKDGVPVFVARYSAHEKQEGDTWSRTSGEITAWHYLGKKDGTLNEFQIQQLQQALGWSGGDVTELESLVDVPCRITIEEDFYNGKARTVVKWVNHIDDDGGNGGVPSKNSEKARKIANAMNSKLRALTGGKPVQAPPRPAPASAPTRPAQTHTEQSVWTEFEKIHGAGCEADWWEFCRSQFGDAGIDTITPTQWTTAYNALMAGAALPL